ncbi:MAG TPA: hypothetical protein VGJ48_15945 [Pyrinomonadaceae bacterium]|jgi:hypothetical protein
MHTEEGANEGWWSLVVGNYFRFGPSQFLAVWFRLRLPLAMARVLLEVQGVL